MFKSQESRPHDDQQVDWKRAHEELVRLARAQCGLDGEIGRWLLRAMRSSAHVRLGFGSFFEYAGRLLGCSGRMIVERVRVAEALEELPSLHAALDGGQLAWSAARELTRVAIPRTENDWLHVATGRTLREVEQLVAGHRPGDTPDDPPDPTLRRHLLRFEVSSETLAIVREMMAKVRRESAEPLDDDAALLLVARCVLGEARDDGRSSYQVLLHVCDRCGQADQEANGTRLEVGPEMSAMARCDGQELPADGAPATQTIPPAVRRRVLRRDGRCCRVPGCRHARFVDVHHLECRSEGGRHHPDNLVTLCAAHHRALHRGELLVRGAASKGLSFHHADGTAYGGAVHASSAEKSSRAFRALRRMGFVERDARQALDSVSTHVGLAEPDEALLRRASDILAARTPGAE